MQIMAEFIEVCTIIDSQDGAQKIAYALVSQRLAACVQVSGPIVSTYWWQGKVEHAEEWVCIAKTQRALYKRVEQAIRVVHLYDLPEIVATDITDGNVGYLDWIVQETSAT